MIIHSIVTAIIVVIRPILFYHLFICFCNKVTAVLAYLPGVVGWFVYWSLVLLFFFCFFSSFVKPQQFLILILLKYQLFEKTKS